MNGVIPPLHSVVKTQWGDHDRSQERVSYCDMPGLRTLLSRKTTGFQLLTIKYGIYCHLSSYILSTITHTNRYLFMYPVNCFSAEENAES